MQVSGRKLSPNQEQRATQAASSTLFMIWSKSTSTCGVKIPHCRNIEKVITARQQRTVQPACLEFNAHYFFIFEVIFPVRKVVEPCHTGFDWSGTPWMVLQFQNKAQCKYWYISVLPFSPDPICLGSQYPVLTNCQAYLKLKLASSKMNQLNKHGPILMRHRL